VWTEDADFFGTGVATWTTSRVRLYLFAGRAAGRRRFGVMSTAHLMQQAARHATQRWETPVLFNWTETR